MIYPIYRTVERRVENDVMLIVLGRQAGVGGKGGEERGREGKGGERNRREGCLEGDKNIVGTGGSLVFSTNVTQITVRTDLLASSRDSARYKMYWFISQCCTCYTVLYCTWYSVVY